MTAPVSFTSEPSKIDPALRVAQNGGSPFEIFHRLIFKPALPLLGFG
jgi:hypothetical protein